MGDAFHTAFRDGLQTFVIVGATLAILYKSQSDRVIPAVRWGIAAGLVVSVAAGVFYSRLANQALWRGVFALIGATAVMAITVEARRAMRGPGRPLRGVDAWLSLFLFTVLMITRKGTETALLLGALIFQVRAVDLTIGVLAGSALAGMVAWTWSRAVPRLSLAVFQQVTAIFLFLCVAQLLMFGFHELTEAEVLPRSNVLHDATEEYGPDGRYSRVLTYMLVGLPLGWWLIALFLGNGKTSDGRIARVGR